MTPIIQFIFVPTFNAKILTLGVVVEFMVKNTIFTIANVYY